MANPGLDTVFAKAGVSVVLLFCAELKQAGHMGAPEFQPESWEAWR